MIELAEDERQVFTERMVAEALKGKTPSESPTFYALVGAPGSGKSTLASTIDNAVVISSDHVIAEYAKTLGIDIREDFCDREVGRFATVVSNEIYKASALTTTPSNVSARSIASRDFPEAVGPPMTIARFSGTWLPPPKSGTVRDNCRRRI
jgi:energy-coupling factor transporter ATP-binding protein EcfA2